MVKDKTRQKRSEDEEEVEDVEVEDKKGKKKKKKKSKDQEEETGGKEEINENEEGRKSRKEKKKKKKKAKDKDEGTGEKEGNEEDEEGRKSGKEKKTKNKKEKYSEEDSEEDAKTPKKKKIKDKKDEADSSVEGELNSTEEKDDLNIDPADVTIVDADNEDGNKKPEGKSSFENSELFTLLTAEKDFNRDTPGRVKKLISDGADVNLTGKFNETYLHALMGPKPDGTESAVLAVLYQLIEAGVHANARDNEDFTPLHIAVLNDLSPRIVNALLKVGADPCALNKQDQDAMDLCELETIKDVLEFYGMGLWRLVAAGEAGKVRALVNSWCKIDQVNEKGKKLSTLADEVGNEFVIETLKEFKNNNAVVMAALSGNLQKLEKVVKKDDVDLNTKDWSYTRPSDGKRMHRPLLIECVSLGWFDCARVLVKKGADVNYEVEVVDGKQEPLYMYLFYLMAPQKLLELELFKEVLKKADLSLVQDHYTLFYQCWQMNVTGDLVAQMVENGLQVGTRDQDGYTVRDRILMENYEIGTKGERKKLREALFYVDQNVLNMATSGQVERLEKLAQEGYDYINVANLEGKSAKKLAKMENQKDVVKFLDKLPDFQVRTYQ